MCRMLVILKQLGIRSHDAHLLKARAGTKRVGIDPTDRVDFIAEVIQSNGFALRRAYRRKDIDNAAPNGKITGLLDGIGALIARVIQPRGEPK